MHEVLVNRLGGLSLPRESVVRLTDRPDMTLDVYRGRKTTIQENFSGSNTDGSFTTAVSNSFLSPKEKSLGCRFGIIQCDFLFYIENGILCILIRIASVRRF